MAFAIPTSPIAAPVDYTEATAYYKQMSGVDPGLISTDAGQMVAWAVEKAYGDILTHLLGRGYTTTQISSWYSTPHGKSTFLGLAAWFWSIPADAYNDPSYLEGHRHLRANWDQVMKGGPLFDSTGAYLEPDTGSAGALVQQAEATSRNGLDDDDHDYVVDWDRRSMARNGVAEVVGSRRFSNSYRDSLS